MVRKLVLFCLAGLATAALPGCAENKMTRRNFDTIREGMSNKDEVHLTLGAAHTNLGNQWEYEDEDHHLHATIHFDEKGVVTHKEWMDAKTGEWSGAAPGIREHPEGRTASDEKSRTTINKP